MNGRQHVTHYCTLMRCFLAAARWQVFSSVARVPLQALEELLCRVPLPLLGQHLGFLQQFGVVTKTAKSDNKPRYYVDPHSFSHRLQQRVVHIRQLLESKPDHLAWAWAEPSSSVRLPQVFPQGCSKKQAMVCVLDKIEQTLTQVQRQAVVELDGRGNLRDYERVGNLADCDERRQITAARSTPSLYSLLKQPWIPPRPVADDSQLDTSALTLLQWMEAEVWRKRVHVSLETFFMNRVYDSSYIRRVLHHLIDVGQTLLVPVLVRCDAAATYTVLDERVVDCVLDHCVMAGLQAEDGAALCPLDALQRVVQERLLMGVSLGQLWRLLEHLRLCGVGFEHQTREVVGNEAISWAAPDWLTSRTTFEEYLQHEADRGEAGGGFLRHLHKLMARCCLEVEDPGKVVSRPPLFTVEETLQENDDACPHHLHLDEDLPAEAFNCKFRFHRRRSSPCPRRKSQGTSPTQTEELVVPPLQYQCGAGLWRAFKWLCGLEKHLAGQGRGTWIRDKIGVMIFLYEPAPSATVYDAFDAISHVAFSGARRVLARLAEEVMGLGISGACFVTPSNILHDFPGLLKQAGIIGGRMQPLEIEYPQPAASDAEDEDSGDISSLTREEKLKVPTYMKLLKAREHRVHQRISRLKQKMKHLKGEGKQVAGQLLASLKEELREISKRERTVRIMDKKEPSDHNLSLEQRGERSLEAFNDSPVQRRRGSSQRTAKVGNRFFEDDMQDEELLVGVEAGEQGWTDDGETSEQERTSGRRRGRQGRPRKTKKGRPQEDPEVTVTSRKRKSNGLWDDGKPIMKKRYDLRSDTESLAKAEKKKRNKKYNDDLDLDDDEELYQDDNEELDKDDDEELYQDDNELNQDDDEELYQGDDDEELDRDDDEEQDQDTNEEPNNDADEELSQDHDKDNGEELNDDDDEEQYYDDKPKPKKRRKGDRLTSWNNIWAEDETEPRTMKSKKTMTRYNEDEAQTDDFESPKSDPSYKPTSDSNTRKKKARKTMKKRIEKKATKATKGTRRKSGTRKISEAAESLGLSDLEW